MPSLFQHLKMKNRFRKSISVYLFYALAIVFLPSCALAEKVGPDREAATITRLVQAIIALADDTDRNGIENLLGLRFGPGIKNTDQGRQVQIPGTPFDAFWAESTQDRFLGIALRDTNEARTVCLRRESLGNSLTGWTLVGAVDNEGFRHEKFRRQRTSLTLVTDGQGCVREVGSYVRNDDLVL